MLTLVLGGTRSGKSRHAQRLCGAAAVVYVATARLDDDPEMAARVAAHRSVRPAAWTTIEEPLRVPDAILRAPEQAIVLVDCITVWISNLLWECRALEASGSERVIAGAVDELTAATRARHVIAVSNEVGSGGVPEHPVARLFHDIQGVANQRLAQVADRVILMVAGIPLPLKGGAAATHE
jgi:adenosylcobinamide kinase/adenosylcobinamide-phosphate guanylyltransferase